MHPQAFSPAWDEAKEAVEGLHFGSLNIDERANIGIAKRLGVLREGIPNVKLINVGEAGGALKVMGDGEVFDGAPVVWSRCRTDVKRHQQWALPAAEAADGSFRVQLRGSDATHGESLCVAAPSAAALSS